MMDDNAFDELLKGTERKASATYDVDQEWDAVAATLFPPRRRNPIWIWLGAGLSFLLLISVLLYANSNPLLGAFPLPLPEQPSSIYASVDVPNTHDQFQIPAEDAAQTLATEQHELGNGVDVKPSKTTDQRLQPKASTSSNASLKPKPAEVTASFTNDIVNVSSALQKEALSLTVESAAAMDSASRSSNRDLLTTANHYVITQPIPSLPLDSVFSSILDDHFISIQPNSTLKTQEESSWAFTTQSSLLALNPLTSSPSEDQAWQPLYAWNAGLGIHLTRNSWTFSGGLHYLRRTHDLRSDIATFLADDLSSAERFSPVITNQGLDSNNAFAISSGSGKGTEQAFGLSLGVSKPINQTRWRWGADVQYQTFLPGTSSRSRLSNQGLTLSGELAWQPLIKLPLQVFGTAGIDLMRRYPDFGEFGPNRDWQIGTGIRWTW